jgi:uncharacterized protein (UPF0297 family)
MCCVKNILPKIFYKNTDLYLKKDVKSSMITLKNSIRRQVNNMNRDPQETMMFNVKKELSDTPKGILLSVYKALEEKGYNPINQLVGYFISGDPTYITSHKNARSLIRKMERDELLEELVRFYVDSHR